MVPSSLINKHILLGITGSIAAYKSADLVRRLKEAGATVQVVMTENAKRFITPLTLQAVSGLPVRDDLFDLAAEAAMGHIELARWADMVLVAPATADFMARLATGQADDLLTTLCLATQAPIVIAPAMNQGMWQHALTQANLLALQQKAIHILGPASGSQACGEIGPGRMIEPIDIVTEVSAFFATGELAGLHLLVTAGPTHEAIDPVRFISNGSSGRMGYALAEAARDAGATVTLISGPVALKKPAGIECIDVITAEDMQAAVMKNVERCDIFLAVAAVGDYRAETIASQKIHKTEASLQLILARNPDIVASVAALTPKPFVVGFAAETENVIANARAKRQRKKMDMIVANWVAAGIGMGSQENEVTVLSDHQETTISRRSKSSLARLLITNIADEFKKRLL